MPTTPRSLLLGLTLPLSFVAGGAATAAPAIHDGPSAPVEAWAKAMNAGDLDAITKMHGPSTVAFPPGTTKLEGADAIAKDYGSLFGKFDVKVKVEEAHWLEEGPYVVSWGISTLTLHPKEGGGKDSTIKTRFTDVAEKTDGGWRYVVDHASVSIGKD